MGLAAREIMIQLNNVFKFYRKRGHTKIILDHVSAVFDSSHAYGLIGVNGAGKSTTLRLIAGTELPNSGSVRRSVRVSWPVGLGSAFDYRMTGRENVHFVARAYGADIHKVSDFVEDFAELGEYIDVPIRTYSSGMLARITFAISMAIEFDVYLVDEVTAVGDARFQKRCEEVFTQRRKNTGLILITHSMPQIKQYCDRAGVLVEGQLFMFDDPEKAIEMYSRVNR